MCTAATASNAAPPQTVNIPLVSDFNNGSRLKSKSGTGNMVNLRTPNVSHPSIQDEKSSMVGAINDLIPKYSNSSVMRQQQIHHQSPNFASSGMLG